MTVKLDDTIPAKVKTFAGETIEELCSSWKVNEPFFEVVFLADNARVAESIWFNRSQTESGWICSMIPPQAKAAQSFIEKHYG